MTRKDSVNCVIISNNNRYIVSVDLGSEVKVFDLELKKELHSFPKVHQSQFSSV